MKDIDRTIVDIASRLYLQRGSLDNAIRDETGMTPTVFWAQLNRLLDDPAAEQAKPELVHRLRRIRDRAALQRRAG